MGSHGPFESAVHLQPEPGVAFSLASGMALLAALARRRRR
jgi:uncharacterized protein (TIGR03382 family)